jgi:cytoskeletal protein CcmA (bactofilin family)
MSKEDIMVDETNKTVIAEDVEIVGTVKCTGAIRLDGKLSGDLGCQANAVIGKTAVVKGNIAAESVSIEGQVAGNITAKDRIEMKSTAQVNGDIHAKRLTVEDGVSFVGKSEVNPSGATASPGVESKPQGESAAPGVSGQQKSDGAQQERK